MKNFLASILGGAGCIGGLAQQPAAAQLTEFDIVRGGGGGSVNGAFGWSIALEGGIAAVGAVSENGAEPSSGVVYIFERQGTSWTQQARLRASNGGIGDRFGRSVDLSGDTLVVGAWYEDGGSRIIDGNGDDNSSRDSGAAYIFVRDSSGTWSQQAYLKASNADGGGDNPFLGDHFGYSVAISGDTVAVGGTGEDSASAGVDSNQFDNGASNSGAVYVFTRDEDDIWSQQAYIKAPAPDAGDFFGNSLALDADTLVVGASGEDGGTLTNFANNSASNSGATFVYQRIDDEWEFDRMLKAPNLEADDAFGHRVAVDGETIVVSAPGEDGSSREIDGAMTSNRATDSGAVYVFERVDGQWIHQTYIKAHNTAPGDDFGYGIALSGDAIVVGAPQTESSLLGGSNFPGVAYRFVRNEGEGPAWRPQDFITASNSERNANFGFGVAVSDTAVLVSAPRSDFFSGSAYIFGSAAETTSQIESIEFLPNRTLRLTMQIAIGRNVGVEYSPDMSPGSWVQLGNFFEMDGEAVFVDPDFFRLDRQNGFYRAFLRPW